MAKKPLTSAPPFTQPPATPPANSLSNPPQANNQRRSPAPATHPAQLRQIQCGHPHSITVAATSVAATNQHHGDTPAPYGSCFRPPEHQAVASHGLLQATASSLLTATTPSPAVPTRQQQYLQEPHQSLQLSATSGHAQHRPPLWFLLFAVVLLTAHKGGAAHRSSSGETLKKKKTVSFLIIRKPRPEEARLLLHPPPISILLSAPQSHPLPATARDPSQPFPAHHPTITADSKPAHNSTDSNPATIHPLQRTTPSTPAFHLAKQLSAKTAKPTEFSAITPARLTTPSPISPASCHARQPSSRRRRRQSHHSPFPSSPPRRPSSDL
ncbi:uncharacterized protein LOC131155926 [Malania oleifera]|uniref:uncharacterized protein LOC131155926 n=1 Tax=Malania oleifera TaxID=397392 RepID=UPI0025AE51BA|nr:uncharacterized protein LOC131155926 [Malania oleifera]